MSGPDSTTLLVCSATLQILPLRFDPLGFFFLPHAFKCLHLCPFKETVFGRIDRVYDSDEFLSFLPH